MAQNKLENYGEKIKELRVKMKLTQLDVAKELNVTPGYICNVENGRTAMSLRILIYYAKLMNISLDALVGEIEPEYKEIAVERELINCVRKLSVEERKKLVKTIKIWQK